jgi:hypothetical protein
VDCWSVRGGARRALPHGLAHRAAALRSTSHARTPDIVANLQAGFEIFLEFAVECRAIDAFERERLMDLCWEALSSAAAAQAKHQAATEPTERFMCLLRSLLSSGRAHLAPRIGGKPSLAPGRYGWRVEGSGDWSPLGDCIGWVDGDDLYLDPTAAYRLAQVAGRDIGEVFAVSEQTLRKRLREKGLLASVDQPRGTLTVRRIIDGSSREVLHLFRSTVLPDESDEPETED